jgi:hypothetical protein
MAMNPGDSLAAIRDASLAKLAKARPAASALTLGPGVGPEAMSPDALIVPAGGVPPAAWLAWGWRPAFVECGFAAAAEANAALEALDGAGYESFRAGDTLFALRRKDFAPGDIVVYRLLRDQSLALVALSNMLAGKR